MASASETSSFDSPTRSRPNRMPTLSPADSRPAASAMPSSGPKTRFIWPRSRAVVAST